MDPDACLAEFLSICRDAKLRPLLDSEREDAIQHLQELALWIERGGFLPSKFN